MKVSLFFYIQRRFIIKILRERGGREHTQCNPTTERGRNPDKIENILGTATLGEGKIAIIKLSVVSRPEENKTNLYCQSN